MDKKNLLYTRPVDFARQPFCDVSPEDIEKLVYEFYARIRKDEILGPIFNDIIGDNWDEHLQKMCAFWRSVILKTSEYSGRPMPAHALQSSIKIEHFPMWLSLFKDTANDVLDKKSASVFIDRAERIATSLVNGIMTIR